MIAIAKDGRRKTEDGKYGKLFVSRSVFVPLSVFLLLSSVFQGCGKKAPPLAPLNLAPEPPQTVTARRLGDTVYLQMTVPDRSMTGRGAFSVDHIDVYAVTIAPGTPTPPNRDFLKPAQVIAQVPVRPPIDPDAPEPETPDTRPGPGDTITFVEKLTEAQLVPQTITKPAPPPKVRKPKAKKGGEAAPVPAVSTTPPAPVGPLVLTRVYVVEGVPKGGKGAAPSTRLEVPLLQAPGAPRPGTATADENSVTVTWEPPPSTTDEAPGVLYNVYQETKEQRDATQSPKTAPVPLNATPLTETTFTHPGAAPGKEQCFVIRSVAAVGTTSIESDPTPAICITPTDTFPPAAPKGLAAVGSAGVINLIWDANTDPDLAGYIVLRGEAAGATLQPLTNAPIADTRYADRTAKPGVRYAYQIVAVDKAGNRSALSNRVEEAAR